MNHPSLESILDSKFKTKIGTGLGTGLVTQDLIWTCLVKRLCPNGINIAYESIGGEVLDTVIDNIGEAII